MLTSSETATATGRGSTRASRSTAGRSIAVTTSPRRWAGRPDAGDGLRVGGHPLLKVFQNRSGSGRYGFAPM